MAECGHLDQVEFLEPEGEVEGCAECLAAGEDWVHLRLCQTCGAVGCCDDSPNKHATAHYHATGHPIIRSLELGEEWSWCYEDEVLFRLRAA